MVQPRLLSTVRGGIYSRTRVTFLSERKKGFTLIELLVVIAIIALLVSILLPSLKRAKDLAMNVVCKTNVRGIGMASALYRNDFDDTFPYAAPETYGLLPATIVTVATYMTGGLGEADGVLPSYDFICNTPAEDRILYPYAEDTNIWKCPSDHWDFWGGCAPAGVDETWKYYGSSYSFNTGNGGSGGLYWGRKGADVSQPSVTIQYGEYVVNNFWANSWPLPEGAGVRFHDQDNPYANIVFVDGHVDFVLMLGGAEWQVADDGSYSFFP